MEIRVRRAGDDMLAAAHVLPVHCRRESGAGEVVPRELWLLGLGVRQHDRQVDQSDQLRRGAREAELAQLLRLRGAGFGGEQQRYCGAGAGSSVLCDRSAVGAGDRRLPRRSGQPDIGLATERVHIAVWYVMEIMKCNFPVFGICNTYNVW